MPLRAKNLLFTLRHCRVFRCVQWKRLQNNSVTTAQLTDSRSSTPLSSHGAELSSPVFPQSYGGPSADAALASLLGYIPSQQMYAGNGANSSAAAAAAILNHAMVQHGLNSSQLYQQAQFPYQSNAGVNLPSSEPSGSHSAHSSPGLTIRKLNNPSGTNTSAGMSEQLKTHTSPLIGAELRRLKISSPKVASSRSLKSKSSVHSFGSSGDLSSVTGADDYTVPAGGNSTNASPQYSLPLSSHAQSSMSGVTNSPAKLTDLSAALQQYAQQTNGGAPSVQTGLGQFQSPSQTQAVFGTCPGCLREQQPLHNTGCCFQCFAYVCLDVFIPDGCVAVRVVLM